MKKEREEITVRPRGCYRRPSGLRDKNDREVFIPMNGPWREDAAMHHGIDRHSRSMSPKQAWIDHPEWELPPAPKDWSPRKD